MSDRVVQGIVNKLYGEDHKHAIDGATKNERMKQVIARHLCEWIGGHEGPEEHFLVDAELIMEDLAKEGLL